VTIHSGLPEVFLIAIDAVERCEGISAERVHGLFRKAPDVAPRLFASIDTTLEVWHGAANPIASAENGSV
jgi:hypothetical protein